LVAIVREEKHLETAQSSRSREYETVYLLKPTTIKASAEKVAGRIVDVVGREGGKLTTLENWGRRKLAFPVQKHTRGVYVYVKYVGSGELVREIERNLKMLDDVMKYQTVKTRDELELDTIEVDPEAVKYEALEPASDDDEEDSLERRLGLDGSRFERRHDRSDDDSNDDDSDDDSEPAARNNKEGADAAKAKEEEQDT
jgi:small subunit ribosomal protein S6